MPGLSNPVVAGSILVIRQGRQQQKTLKERWRPLVQIQPPRFIVGVAQWIEHQHPNSDPSNLRSLMGRICGFHPQDPGSIPGVDECPGMTLKAFQRMYPRGLRARSYRTDVSLVRIQSCVIRGMAQRKRAWLITTRSQDRNLLPR